jgi:GNAT superfamily N-acetyltransferase
MPEGYMIRRAARQDLSSIGRLGAVSRLLKSGPPDAFTPFEFGGWQDDTRVLTLVACPIENPTLIVSSAEIQLLRTSLCRKAQLEDVCTDPEHEGRGLGRAIVGRLFWHAEHRWNVGKIIWVSEDIPERQAARSFYLNVIGAGLSPGTNANFFLKCPWAPPEKMTSHHVDYRR